MVQQVKTLLEKVFYSRNHSLFQFQAAIYLDYKTAGKRERKGMNF